VSGGGAGDVDLAVSFFVGEAGEEDAVGAWFAANLVGASGVGLGGVGDGHRDDDAVDGEAGAVDPALHFEGGGGLVAEVEEDGGR